jgi:hypothetical protein
MSSIVNTLMLQRGLRPLPELATDRPHGDRLRYLAGCRCMQCRAANTAYFHEREQAKADGDWNGIVSADRARQHIEALSAKGIGRRAVSMASDVPESIISAIRRGSRTKIRALTERKILAVTHDAASDGALVDAAPSWKLINALLVIGFSKARLARELGAKTPALQVRKKQVTVRKAYDIRRMHDRLIQSDEVPVDASAARSKIRELRNELIRASQIARELGIEHLVEDGEITLPHRIPRSLEKAVFSLYDKLTT